MGEQRSDAAIRAGDGGVDAFGGDENGAAQVFALAQGFKFGGQGLDIGDGGELVEC